MQSTVFFVLMPTKRCFGFWIRADLLDMVGPRIWKRWMVRWRRHHWHIRSWNFSAFFCHNIYHHSLCRSQSFQQIVEKSLRYAVVRCLTLWHPGCHLWRKPPWEFLWLNEKSHQRVPWCQTTLSNSLPRWCGFFLKNYTGLLLPSSRVGLGRTKA